jgi:WG containing repeat
MKILNFTILVIIFTSQATIGNAQKLTLNKYGIVSNKNFKATIKAKGYNLVGGPNRFSVKQGGLLVYKNYLPAILDTNTSKLYKPNFYVSEESLDEPKYLVDERPYPPKEIIPSVDYIKATVINYGKQKIIQKANGDSLLLIDCEQVILSEHNNYFVYIKNGKWGLGHRINGIITEAIYNSIKDVNCLNTNYKIVKIEKKWGLINYKGKTILPTIYHDLEELKPGYFLHRTRTDFGVIDSTGRYIIDTFCSGISMLACNQNLYNIYINTDGQYRYAILDNNGKWLTDTLYLKPVVMRDEHNLITINYKNNTQDLGYDNNNQNLDSIQILSCEDGKPITPDYYRDVILFGNNLIVKKCNSTRYGILTNNGKYVVEPEFDAFTFGSLGGNVIVRRDGKYGLMDKSGKLIIPYQYNSIAPINGHSNILLVGLADDSKQLKYGLLNSSYNIEVNPIYESIINIGANLMFKLNGKYGVFSSNYKQLIAPEYTAIKYMNEKDFVCNTSSYTNIIARDGTLITTLPYTNVSATGRPGILILEQMYGG